MNLTPEIWTVQLDKKTLELLYTCFSVFPAGPGKEGNLSGMVLFAEKYAAEDSENLVFSQR